MINTTIYQQGYFNSAGVKSRHRIAAKGSPGSELRGVRLDKQKRWTDVLANGNGWTNDVLRDRPPECQTRQRSPGDEIKNDRNGAAKGRLDASAPGRSARTGALTTYLTSGSMEMDENSTAVPARRSFRTCVVRRRRRRVNKQQ